MLLPPIPKNESIRLEALHALNILDTPPDFRFDNITQFAAENLGVPICTITFLDLHRQWFKSTYGIDVTEMPRDISICAHAICETTGNHPRKRVFEIKDLNEDSRFFDNPFVIKEPRLRSYICFVLCSKSKMNIGTFCLVDTQPRRYKYDEVSLIIELGFIVEDLINRNHSSKKYQNVH